MPDLTPAQRQQQFEGARLSVAAYGAAKISALLATNPSPHVLSAGLVNILLGQGFTPAQASSFASKYTPVAALDQSGAGAVLFRDSDTGKIAVAVRGTETQQNFTNDLVLSDGSIALGHLPTYQTVLIANFVLRETTPSTQNVPQFSLDGVSSNSADLAAAGAIVVTDPLAYASASTSVPTLNSVPKVVQSGSVQGTGRALGGCVDAGAHSEGSPEVTVVGSALAQCTRITTVNGPGVPLAQMQGLTDQITAGAGLPQQNLSSQNQLNVHTTGVSIIDGLNGGLPGQDTTLQIPTSLFGIVGSHSSIVAMNAAEAALADSLKSPKSPNEAFRQFEINQQNNTAPDGQPYGTTTVVAANTKLTWDKTDQPGLVTRTTEVRNSNGSVTRIVENVDRATGNVVSERIYENNHSTYNPNAPDTFKLVGVYDATTGQRQSLNRDTGLMEPVAGTGTSTTDRPATVFNPSTALPNAPTNEGGAPGYVVQPGDTVGSIALKLGLTPQQYSDYLRSVYGPNADLNSIVAGRELPVPTDAPNAGVKPSLGDTPSTATPSADNDYQAGNSNGEAEAQAYISSQTTTSGAVDQLVDALNNTPPLPSDPGIQLAAAPGDTRTDAGPGSVPDSTSIECAAPVGPPQPTIAAPYSYDSFIQSLGPNLQPSQLAAIGKQLDGLNLGGAGDLSFYQLPDGGGTILLNADGEAVGEITRSSDGNLHITANTVNADGSAGTVSRHITPGGATLTDGQYATQMVADGLTLVNTIAGLRNWDQMSGLQQVTTIASLYTQIDNLGSAFGGSGNNLPGDLGMAVGVLSLVQNLKSGNVLGTLSSINSLTGNAIDTALAETFGANIPYLGVILALNDFESHPGQSIGTLVGMCFGPAGAVIGGMIGGLLDGMGEHAPPPPPEGIIHYQWDSSGQISVVIDQDQSGGGAPAKEMGENLLELMQGIVEAINANTPGTEDDLALNPSMIPRVGYSDTAGMWLEITLPGGLVTRESIDSETIAERLLQLLAESGGLAPVWLTETLKQTGASVDDVENRAVESADGKTQSYGAMIVHLQGNADLGDAIKKVSTTQQTAGVEAPVVYRNTDDDGYLEKTEWISATDADGVAQGILVLDLNGNGVVETGDILSDMRWLDVNKDGVVDSSDPAFAAIKLWVDINQDGAMQSGEGQSLKSLNIKGFDLATGQVLYEDGSSAAITATTLQADTAGVKGARIQVVGDDGGLETVDAGNLIEHEAVDGGEVTYDHNAKRTGDWEGTEEQDAHRHGGGNVEGAPTETYATGTISVGPIKAGTPVVQSGRVVAGDGRVVSDAPTAAPVRAPNAVAEIGVGDSRIKSNAAPLNRAQTAKSVVQSPQLALIPRGPKNAQNAMRIVTQEMIQSAQTGMSGALNLTALAAVGLGAAQTSVFAAPTDFVQESAANLAAAPGPMQWTATNAVSDTSAGGLPTANGDASRQVREVAPTVFRHVDLGNFVSEPPRLTPSPSLNPFSDPSMTATLIVDPSGNGSDAEGDLVHRDPSSVDDRSPFVDPASLVPLDYPKVRGETLGGSEDLVLRMDSSLLLANDSTINAAADPTQPALRIVSVGQPEHGQISLQTHTDAQGRTVTEVLYAPDRDFHGTVSFTYTVSDQYGLTRTATAILQIEAVNDAPVTANESALGDEDTGLIFDATQLLANDWDADSATDGQTLSISRVGDARHGTTWLDAQGNVRFMPDADYHGPAQLTYWVSDGAGAETPATIALTIAGVNDVPVAVGESAGGAEDIGLVFAQAQLLANDSDPDTASDGQTLSVGRVGDAQHGIVWLDTEGNIRFSPEANYHGPAQFNYWVSDGAGGETVATVRLVLTAVNDAPVTGNESATGSEDAGLIFTAQQLLANDVDPDTVTDGQVLSISRIDGAQNGSAWLDSTGNIRFMPDPDYHGPASFNYWVSDGAGGETMATVNLTIASVNDLPVVTGEIVNSDEDVTLLFNPATLLANDTDADGSALTISAVGNATHGTVALVGGQIQFIPEPNFHGTAGFEYTVNDGDGGLVTGTVVLNLAPINDTPVVQDDQLGVGYEGTPLHISFASLLANDSDPDTGDTLTIDAVGSATHGTVAIVNGEVVFTPAAGYHGPASFVYRVHDSSGAQATGLATLSFSGVNDAPIAVGETIYSNEDTTLLISSAALLQNDTDVDIATDGQVLSLIAVSNPQHGSVNLRSDGTIEFIPDPDFYGNASFVYTISDGAGGTAQATATISIANVNDGPIATGETVSGQAGQVLTISAAALLQNEYDPDNTNNQLAINSVQAGIGGTVALNGSGDVVFTPQAGFTGTATFTYSVRDPSGATSNTVTASIVLSAAPNTSPTVQGEIVNGAIEDAVFHISRTALLANDSDAEDANSVLSIVLVGNATNGSVALDGNGDIVFTPDPNFNGTASFQYQVRDSQGALSATVQAIIPVAAVNDLPMAVDDQFQTYKNSTMTIGFGQLTGNDSDADGDALTVSGVRNASHGSVSIVGGNVQFIPTAGYTGTASFEYLSDDGHGGQTWATAQVTVSNPPNLYPSISVSLLYFRPTGSTASNLFDIGEAWLTPSDDGNVSSITLDYVSGSYLVFPGGDHPGWRDLSGFDKNFFNWSPTKLHIDIKRGDALAEMQTVWKITDDQGLVNYWHFNYSMTGGLNSYMEYTGYAPPLVLALNNMPSEYISTKDSNVYFDMNGDGILDKLAWSAPGSGVLGIDLNGDGRISNASEFAFKQYVAGAQTDLEGLVAFDTNHNGILDAGDEQWSKFGVWEDKNADGVTQEGEYLSLDQLGIESINLQSNAQMHTPTMANGATDVVVMGETSFKRADGSVGVASDAMFTYQSGMDANAAQIAQMAQVFNQFSNVSQGAENIPIGFDAENERVHWHAIVGMQQAEEHAVRVLA